MGCLLRLTFIILAVFSSYMGDGFAQFGRGKILLVVGFVWFPRASLFLAWAGHRPDASFGLGHALIITFLAMLDLNGNRKSTVTITDDGPGA